jgi:hypothetical protein
MADPGPSLAEVALQRIEVLMQLAERARQKEEIDSPAPAWDVFAVEMDEWFHETARQLRDYDDELARRLMNRVRMREHGYDLPQEFRDDFTRAHAFLTVHAKHSANAKRFQIGRPTPVIVCEPTGTVGKSRSERRPLSAEHVAALPLLDVLRAVRVRHLGLILTTLASVGAVAFGGGVLWGRALEANQHQFTVSSARQEALTASERLAGCQKEIAEWKSRLAVPAKNTDEP